MLSTECGYHRAVPSTQEQYVRPVLQPVTGRQGRLARSVCAQRRHPDCYLHLSPNMDTATAFQCLPIGLTAR
jgi:hypothetical protein